MKEARIAHYILFATFLFYGCPCPKNENMTLQCPNSYEIQPYMTGHTNLGFTQV